MNVTVRSWRISSALDSRGLMCYFDPFLEDISIRVLTGPEKAARLTESVSVSALVEVEDDFAYDPEHVNMNRDFFDGPS